MLADLGVDPGIADPNWVDPNLQTEVRGLGRGAGLVGPLSAAAGPTDGARRRSAAPTGHLWTICTAWDAQMGKMPAPLPPRALQASLTPGDVVGNPLGLVPVRGGGWLGGCAHPSSWPSACCARCATAALPAALPAPTRTCMRLFPTCCMHACMPLPVDPDSNCLPPHPHLR